MNRLEQIIAGPDALSGPDLQAQTLRAASGLAALGVRAGDCVAILMRNDLPQVVATLAAQHLGAYPVQVNWHAASAEVQHVLSDCGARLHRLAKRHGLAVLVLNTATLDRSEAPAAGEGAANRRRRGGATGRGVRKRHCSSCSPCRNWRTNRWRWAALSCG